MVPGQNTLSNRQNLPVQWFGLGQTSLSSVKLCQIAECEGIIDVILTISVSGLLNQLLGFIQQRLVDLSALKRQPQHAPLEILHVLVRLGMC
jgi:hypothetical protein